MIGIKQTNPLKQHILGKKKDRGFNYLGKKLEPTTTKMSSHNFKSSHPVIHNITDEEVLREPKGINIKQNRNQDFYN